MSNHTKIENINEKIFTLAQTDMSISRNLTLLERAEAAVSKYAAGKRPRERAINNWEALRQTFPSYFLNDNGQPMATNNREDYSAVLDRIATLKNELTEQRSANSNIWTQYEEERAELRRNLFEESIPRMTKKDESSKLGTAEKDESSKLGTIEMGESSKLSISESLESRVKRIKTGPSSDEMVKTPSVESDEKGKGKGPAPDSGQGESPSFDDFYNPFDDIGFD